MKWQIFILFYYNHEVCDNQKTIVIIERQIVKYFIAKLKNHNSKQFAGGKDDVHYPNWAKWKISLYLTVFLNVRQIMCAIKKITAILKNEFM